MDISKQTISNITLGDKTKIVIELFQIKVIIYKQITMIPFGLKL